MAVAGDGFAVTVDGRSWQVDAARVGAHLWSLLVAEVSPHGEAKGALPRPDVSHEVAVSRDPATGQLTLGIGAAAIAATLNGRRRRKDDGGRTEGGPQRVVAPMPGKIVRVLVKPGDGVRARQGLVVVEAMKMENEVRALGEGIVTEIHVKEGASIDAGALMVVIE